MWPIFRSLNQEDDVIHKDTFCEDLGYNPDLCPKVITSSCGQTLFG